MTSGYRAFVILIPALLLFTVVSSAASEAEQLRHQCLDNCRIESTACTTGVRPRIASTLAPGPWALPEKVQEDAPARDPVKRSSAGVGTGTGHCDLDWDLLLDRDTKLFRGQRVTEKVTPYDPRPAA